jgi:hypothetical protein
MLVGVALGGTDWPTKMSALRWGRGSAGASPYWRGLVSDFGFRISIPPLTTKPEAIAVG